MTSHRQLLPLALLLTDIACTAASPPTMTLTDKVVKIADGDTLTLLVGKTQINVRLEGIDTPERGQPFGRKAGAWWYRKYAPKKKELAKAEAAARKAKRGLWADANPIPPWEWRQRQSRADVGTGSRHNPSCPQLLQYQVWPAVWHGRGRCVTSQAADRNRCLY